MTAVITQERLKELFTYDPETGEFARKAIPGVACLTKIGSVGKNGYLKLGIDYQEFYAHRLVILYMTGEMPSMDMRVDHIDRNKLNNRFLNLRVVTHQINMQNRSDPSKTANRTGRFLGVSKRWDGKKWIAQIRVNGKCIRIGSSFDSEEDAYQAYLSAKRKFHSGNAL